MKQKRSNKILFETAFCTALLVALSLIGLGCSKNNPNKNTDGKFFTVQRGNLKISVTESGEIKALNSESIKCEVEGQTKIIEIVDEGTVITPEDVNNEMILVKLDASEIQKRLIQQEISFLNVKAGLKEAEENLDIQINKNESDIQKAKMKVQFALIDVRKYLGEMLSEELVAPLDTNDIDVEQINQSVDDERLGGDAVQKLRDLDSKIKLNEQDLELAESKLEWTQKLYEKEYVSLNDLQADQLDKQRKEIELSKAKTARKLFVEYEYPKQVQKLLSDYREAIRELQRTEAQARSILNQKEAQLESSKARFEVQQKELQRLNEQLEYCTIKATTPGQVVYASSEDEWMRRNRPIEVGANVHRSMKIISLPDPSVMKVEIKVHENWVNKVKIDQPAVITIPAFPEKQFTGKVIYKAPLADQSRWWANPDLKVYLTDVSIDGTHSFIKTGMSAKVEIIIEELENVLYVPIHAVVSDNGDKYCFVVTSSELEKRKVETGLFNDAYVEIKSGLSENEKVSLSPPRQKEQSDTTEKKDQREGASKA